MMEWKKKWALQPGLMLITVVIWSVFVGLCIETGAILFNTLYSLARPIAAQNLYKGLDLSGLMARDMRHYIGILSVILYMNALKAYMFYLMIRIFLKINLIHPFSKPVSNLIAQISQITMQIAIVIIFTDAYLKWLAKRGFELPDLGAFTGGAFEYILMGVIIYALSKVFKRGLEIQSENELTI